MDTNSQIKQWLNNPAKTFEEGLSLYELVKKETKKDAFFRSKPTFSQGTIQFNILIQELARASRILDQNQPETKFQPAVIQQAVKPINLNTPANKANFRRASGLKITDVNPDVKYSELPEEMKAKFDEIRELSKKLGGLKLMLDSVDNNEERQQVANEICTSYDRRRQLWMELDEWNETANKELQNKALTPDEIKKQIKIKRDNINRKLKDKDPKNKKKYEESIKRWENEIDELEKLLKEKV